MVDTTEVHVEIGNVGLDVEISYSVLLDFATVDSPAFDTVTIEAVKVVRFTNDSMAIEREENHDWFELLDKAVRKHIDEQNLAETILGSVI